MKKTLCVLAAMAIALTAMAQKKVAILETVDKDQKVSYGVKLLLRSSLTRAISNTPGYEGFDRVDMASIASEQEFQRTGNVSDNQIKRLGEATGAAYVLVAEAALYDEKNIIITAKILDVETFGIKSSAVEVSGISPKDMQKSCANLADQLLTPEADAPVPSKPAAKPSAPVQAPVAVPSVMPASVGSLSTSDAPLAQTADGAMVYVATNDEDERMEYNDARTACSCKGTGWRLPTIDELKLLEKNKGVYGNLNTSYRYWALEGGFTVDMSTGYKVKTKNSVKAKVRCVKEAK